MNMRWFITLPAQLSTMLLSMAIIVFFFNKSLERFNPLGKGSFVMKVTPEVVKKWGHEPTHVKTGFLLHEFIRFDVTKNDFLINAILWFEFDPSKISLETLGKFSFTKGDILKQSDAVVKKLSDNLSFAQYYLRIQFSSVLDYTLFPINDHKVFLNLTNNMVDAESIIFDVAPKDYVVPKYVFLSGWKLESHEAKAGYTEYKLSEDQTVSQQPKVLFSINIKKTDARQLMIILFPLFMLFYFFIFSLFIKDYGLNMQLIFTNLLAFMAYTIVVQGMSPVVGYFMLIDYLMLFFLAAFFVLGVVAYVGDENTGYSPEKVDNIRAWTVLFVYIALIVVMYYLTNVYMVNAA